MSHIHPNNTQLTIFQLYRLPLVKTRYPHEGTTLDD